MTYVPHTDAQSAQMLKLIGDLWSEAPAGSLFAVESDDRFDFSLLPDADEWDVRTYRPAVLGVAKKGEV